MKRVLSVLLLFAVISTAFAGCSEKKTSDDPAVTTAADTIETTVETEYLDTIPADTSYDGYNFVVGWSTPYDVNECAYTLEEAAGDLINEAIYERNRRVEDKLDISISAERMCDWTAITNTVQTMASANDCPYDYFSASTWFMFQCSINGLLTNLHDIPSLDLDNPWWDNEADEMYGIGSKSLYFASGMINYFDDYATTAMFFNKDLCDDNGISYPYDSVRAGEWTFDKLYTMTQSYGGDVNGDTVLDENDTYGMVENNGAMTRVFNSCGVSVVSIDNSGSVTVNSETKIFDVFDSVFERFFGLGNSKTLIVERKLGYDKGGDMFERGQVLVKGDAIVGNIAAMRQSMEDDFGVVPYPKYDEAQQNYYDSYNTAWGTVIAIPITNLELERTGLILDALGSCSRDTVYNAVVEKNVLTKATRDDESAEMLGLIFTTKFYELGQWGTSVYNNVCNMLNSGKNTLASVLESVASATESEFASVREHYVYD